MQNKMQNMTKNMSKTMQTVCNMQNTDRSILCIFVIYMHSHFADGYHSYDIKYDIYYGINKFTVMISGMISSMMSINLL